MLEVVNQGYPVDSWTTQFLHRRLPVLLSFRYEYDDS